MHRKKNHSEIALFLKGYVNATNTNTSVKLGGGQLYAKICMQKLAEQGPTMSRRLTVSDALR